MTTALQTNPSSRATKDGAALRVVSALSPAEEKAFFADENWPRELGAACHLDRFSSDDLEGWHQLIREDRPDIVLGAWRTLPLPPVEQGKPPVKYYCHAAGSVRRVVSESHLQSGMLVSNWGIAVGRYIAEMALVLILGSLRNLPHYHENIHRRGGWREGERWPEQSLFGKRVGLHGFGAIAREVVHLLAPFQTQISAWDPFVAEAAIRREGVRPAESLEALFEQSEVLVECCALTDETNGIVSADLLGRMTPGAVFVNVARGQLVDEAALQRAISENGLRAGLDVFSHEPLARESPLRGLDNLICTPHIAGNTLQSRLSAGKHALANIKRYAEGSPVEGLIDLEQYRRMS